MTSTAPEPDDRRETRTRLLESAAGLFSRQGYGGTGIKTVLADAQAPYGSLYHFFPGGKEELGAAALKYGADKHREDIERFHPPGSDAVEATRISFEHTAEIMTTSDYTHACPVATVALETSSTHERLREAAATAFASWIDVLQTRYAEAGMSDEVAHEVAIQCFCLMEGALLLARTSKSVEPLHVAGRAAVGLITDALADS